MFVNTHSPLFRLINVCILIGKNACKCCTMWRILFNKQNVRQHYMYVCVYLLHLAITLPSIAIIFIALKTMLPVVTARTSCPDIAVRKKEHWS